MKHVGLFCALLLSCTLFAQQVYNITAPYDPATVKMEADQRGASVVWMTKSINCFMHS